MKSNEFNYWLKGFFELTSAQVFSETQYQLILKELDLVFKEDKVPNSFCVELKSAFQFVDDSVPSEQFVSNLKTRLEQTLKAPSTSVKPQPPKEDRPQIVAMC